MPASLKDIIVQVLRANDIVDVIGRHLELRPAGGARFKALCPFHNEKTPSFSVDRGRQAYYCFGCEKHGDAITFLSEHEGLPFREALQKLADRAGLSVPEISGRDSEQDKLRARLIEFGKIAAGFFRDTLRNPLAGEPGRQYLKARRLKDETIARFGLGYVPEAWNALTDHARAKGFTESLLEASGLARRGEKGTLYDFFRNRLIFPIRDVAGNVVAFGGRDLGDSPAKYINSPESEIYKKSRELYGLYESRDALRKSRQAILVEGYFDLLRFFDAGIENVVATCGTALTPDQAALIRRYAPEVLVVYDGDAAGIKAALRGVGILIAAGLSVRALILPDGQDPDEFIRDHGAEAFNQLAAEALDFVAFYTRTNAARTRSIEGRTEVAREVFAILADIPDELRRDEYVKHLARELGLDPYTCAREFQNFLRDGARRHAAPVERDPAPKSASADADRDFLAIVMQSETMLARAKDSLREIELSGSPVWEVLRSLFDGLGIEDFEDGPARILFAAAANAEITCKSTDVLVEERLAAFRRDDLRRKRDSVREEIERASRSNDTSKVIELIRHKQAIDLEIDCLARV